MSDCSRTLDDVKTLIQSFPSLGSDPHKAKELYDSWTETYEQDHALMNYRAPQLAVDFLSEHFSGNSEEAMVLDVACGSGLVAKMMAELGFKNFVGVDGCEGMLELAAKTNLYQDLKLALLGPDPLPAQTSVFDVVILVGALKAGHAPVSAIRELCNAAKPGGFICMIRANHRGARQTEYKEQLERELQLMEEEGLWAPVGIKQVERYMECICRADGKGDVGPQEKQFVGGTAYLFKKSTR